MMSYQKLEGDLVGQEVKTPEVEEQGWTVETPHGFHWHLLQEDDY